MSFSYSQVTGDSKPIFNDGLKKNNCFLPQIVFF